MKIKLPTTIEKEYPSPAYFKTGNKYFRVYEQNGRVYADTMYLSDEYYSFLGMTTVTYSDLAEVEETTREEFDVVYNQIIDRMFKSNLRHA